ncbi:phosphinothricin acetyltransferase [Filimonas lacunae]|uniref:Phosphinothricin acetyltransferase n=1 Tax=Filimonas lacunae TaxID=477680 RepID=A0A173MBA3_9BACT|nr:GNAT family N-acetyltransferase [Filimonas lacunae]BAV04806.1 phosphinothricin N-acetyltransferase [Filimonas lacunae]SIT34741.1 phosphinothricin acetyltransferase [Filimonas lacunae]
MKPVFRYAALTDLPWVVAVYNSIVAGRMVTADTDEVSVESRLPWFEAHDEKHPLWIVEADGQPVGWVSLQKFYGRPAYDITAEISIYLHESTRGRGLGKIVLQEAIAHSAALGIENLLGFVFAHNIPSMKLFEWAGFSQWANMPGIALLDGEYRSLIILGKKLNTQP